MLNAMRSRAGGFAAKLLLILLIASFAVWGIEDMLKNTGREGALATVDGHEIPRAAFKREYNNQLGRIRTMLGKNYTPELARMLGLERQVLDKMIMAELIRLEINKLGLLPSDEMVRNEIRINPAFKNDEGAFDKAKFIAVLRNNGLTEQSFAQELKHQKAEELLMISLTVAAPVDNLMVATQFEADAEERIAEIGLLTPASVTAPAAPDDAAIEDFYKKHASDFNVPESRSLSYVSISHEELLKDVPVTDAQLKAAYKERAAMFGDNAAPFEKVKDDIAKDLKAEHAEEAASAFARKLEDLLAGGSTLQEAAKELRLSYATVGPVTKEGKTPSGEKVALPPYENFLDLAFRTEEGSDSALTLARDKGYFLLHVEKLTPEQPEPLAQVRDKVITAWKRQQVAKLLQEKAEAVGKEAKESKDPQALLSKAGVNLSPSGVLTRNSPKSSTNLALPAGLMQELFALRPGQATGAYPAAEGNYMIAVLKERRAPRKVTKDMLEKDAQVKQLRSKLEDEAKRMAADEYIAYLRNKYHVIVNDEALSALTSAAQ